MPDSKYDVISADSHVVEPPDVFEPRVPAALKDRMPKLGTVDGEAAWLVEGVEPAPLSADPGDR